MSRLWGAAGEALSRAGTNGTKDQLIDAARRVFARHGVEKTAVTDIVREARVGRATFYKSFGSKEDILQAVLEGEVREMLAEVRAAVGRASGTRARLRTAISTHMFLIREHVILYRITVDALAEMMPLAMWRGQVRHMAEEFVALYGGILEEGIRNGEVRGQDARKAAWLLLFLLKGLFMGSATGDIGDDRETVVDGVVDMVMDGLRPREMKA